MCPAPFPVSGSGSVSNSAGQRTDEGKGLKDVSNVKGVETGSSVDQLIEKFKSGFEVISETMCSFLS